MNELKEAAFEKVKSGEWTFAEFDSWVDRVTSDAWAEGYADGQYFNGLL